MVGDISHGIFSNFRKKIKNRYSNLGILEPTMISMCRHVKNWIYTCRTYNCSISN